jgi:chemotaxis protein histidine kinase CheA
MTRLTAVDGEENETRATDKKENFTPTLIGEEIPTVVETLDTIRVGSDKLDRLMGQTGELAVTNARLSRAIEDLTELIEL